MELGADTKTKQIEDLMKEHTPNQCASLVYTVRHNPFSFHLACIYTHAYTHIHVLYPCILIVYIILVPRLGLLVNLKLSC